MRKNDGRAVPEFISAALAKKPLLVFGDGHQTRSLCYVTDEIDGRMIRIGDQWLADFASCNYLGFDLDREIIASVPEYLEKWGTHPSWSRMLGSPVLYPQIEELVTGTL